MNLLSSFLILLPFDWIVFMHLVSSCRIARSKRKFSLSKTKVFNPTGFFWYTNMAAVSLFWTPIWPPWRHVKTFYTLWYLEFGWYDSETSNFGAQQRQNRNYLIHIYWILMEISHSRDVLYLYCSKHRKRKWWSRSNTRWRKRKCHRSRESHSRSSAKITQNAVGEYRGVVFLQYSFRLSGHYKVYFTVEPEPQDPEQFSLSREHPKLYQKPYTIAISSFPLRNIYIYFS